MPEEEALPSSAVELEPTGASQKLADFFTEFKSSKPPTEEEARRHPGVLTWQFFPRSAATPAHLKDLRPAFESLNQYVFKRSCDGYLVTSKEALEQMVAPLQAYEPPYEVEHQPADAEQKRKVHVPVLFGSNDKVERVHEADAVNWELKTVVEVEAGTGTANNAYLKDIFEASTAVGIDYLVLAMRKLYVSKNLKTKNPDYAKVNTALETILASERLFLPIKVLLVGY